MFAAVQHQNLRTPIVFGLGATPTQALNDAQQHTEALDEIAVLPCTPELVAAVEAGRVECAITNGVAVVVGAE